MKIDTKSLVVQANHIIEARYKLSLEEQRLIKILISMIDEGDKDTKTYLIKASDVAEMLGITDDHIYYTIKQVTAKLLKQVLFIKKDGGELQVSWLSSVEYLKGGMIELEISQKLRPYLLQLKEHFTQYQIRQIARLKSGFSIRIYELCKCNEFKGGFNIKLDDLKKMFMLETKYKLYGDFKRYVLITARDEINETTDIEIEFQEVKEGKKVDSIKFHIKNKAKISEQPSTTTIDSTATIETPINRLLAHLISLGVAKRTAERIINDYDEARITKAIAYLEAKYKEGKVKNPAGFLIEAIKNDYRDIIQAEEREKNEEQKQVQTKKEKEKEAKIAKEKESAAKKQTIDSFISALTEDQLAALEAEFVENSKDNPALMKSLNKNGMNSVLVKSCFRDFLFKQKINS